MCKAIEDMLKETVRNCSLEIAGRLLTDGTLSVEEIAKCCELSVSEVEALAGMQTA